MRKAFTTTIDSYVQAKFKEKCKEDKISMSSVLEIFMSEYSSGRFKLETVKLLKENK